MREPDLIVIGAGAAGLLAAGTAAAGGAHVLLLEKMPRPGLKLAITGKGRCNLTNVEPRGAFESHFGNHGDWLKPAFDTYFSGALMAFMEAEGVPLVTERGGRVFPANGRAPDVVKALVSWVGRLGVEIRVRQPVRQLRLDADGRISGVATATGDLACGAVVLACGGASYPGTGSTGDGYQLAAGVGHMIVPPRAALVPLITRPAPDRGLDGQGLKNVRVWLLVDGQPVAEGFGEMGFATFGVNGPVVLSLSAQAVDALDAGHEVRLKVDLKPALGETKLRNRLDRDLTARAAEPMHSILRGLLPKPLVTACLAATGIRGRLPGNRMTAAQRETLACWLKGMELTISGHRGMNEAIVTAGGVALDGVCPETMASRRVPGLYFAGEILDVHADTGGYNLQAAFSTGVLAGRHAAGLTAQR